MTYIGTPDFVESSVTSHSHITDARHLEGSLLATSEGLRHFVNEVMHARFNVGGVALRQTLTSLIRPDLP